ncbi:hypothetical protein G5B37_07705 [Rasiella rasia]|uniref:Prokaryotic glutathione synthetase ATP-binding domain-containing protein n=1 Tax=Rasiella rasia TaxID=2744027 RepID=A0A6G6GLM3_9FLAO|nr:hypothetical protein [Rasiella rasia]QIE59452.1 hypothetical protein G5B37_07705 [Rasiella rasia]
MIDVTVVTCKKYVSQQTQDMYVANIFLEYNLLKDALEAEGLTVDRTYWDNPDYDWSTTKIALIRTVWDYFERFEAFTTWMEETAVKTKLVNPLKLQQWNSHKFYIKELQDKGVRVVATEFVSAKSKITLAEISKKRGWKKMVLKPAISAAAFHTYKVSEENSQEMERVFQQLVASRDMLVQEFLETITTRGEASLMIFNGTYSHAILKRAKPGDFRVQDDFGGTVHPYSPSKDEIEFAENANRQCPIAPVYGRVDIVWDETGSCYLSEMEFLDPEIWLRDAPKSAHQLAAGIVKMLD